MTTETMAEPKARPDERATNDYLLEVRDLRTYFHVMDGTVMAVDGVDFALKTRRDARRGR